MKRITLHRAAVDNSGAFVDAGAELTIGDGDDAATITADRARELIDSHGAVDPDAVPAASAADTPTDG